MLKSFSKKKLTIGDLSSFFSVYVCKRVFYAFLGFLSKYNIMCLHFNKHFVVVCLELICCGHCGANGYGMTETLQV